MYRVQCTMCHVPCKVLAQIFFFTKHDALLRFLLYRAFMERLRRVFHTDDRKVLVSIDRLDLCKVGLGLDSKQHGSKCK